MNDRVEVRSESLPRSPSEKIVPAGWANGPRFSKKSRVTSESRKTLIMQVLVVQMTADTAIRLSDSSKNPGFWMNVQRGSEAPGN